MSQRAQLMLLHKRLRRRMDAERAAFTKALIKATIDAAGGDDPMTAFTLERMRNARQRVLDEWYGSAPGDERGRFFKLMQEQGQLAYRLAAAAERDMVAHKLRGRPRLLRHVSA